MYRDPGAHVYDAQHRTQVLRRLRQRAANLGLGLVDHTTGEVAEGTVSQELGFHLGFQAGTHCGGLVVFIRNSGEPGGNRTHNPQIKSLLLCQLSYRPAGKYLIRHLGGLTLLRRSKCEQQNRTPRSVPEAGIVSQNDPRFLSLLWQWDDSSRYSPGPKR